MDKSDALPSSSKILYYLIKLCECCKQKKAEFNLEFYRRIGQQFSMLSTNKNKKNKETKTKGTKTKGAQIRKT
jgi:hypothetical protein